MRQELRVRTEPLRPTYSVGVMLDLYKVMFPHAFQSDCYMVIKQAHIKDVFFFQLRGGENIHSKGFGKGEA